MEPVVFDGVNTILKKPEHLTEECGDLPVKICCSPNPERELGPSVESVWELTPEEIEIITVTRRVRLGIYGMSQPPVYMEVEQSRIEGHLATPEELATHNQQNKKA